MSLGGSERTDGGSWSSLRALGGQFGLLEVTWRLSEVTLGLLEVTYGLLDDTLGLLEVT